MGMVVVNTGEKPGRNQSIHPGNEGFLLAGLAGGESVCLSISQFDCVCMLVTLHALFITPYVCMCVNVSLCVCVRLTREYVCVCVHAAYLTDRLIIC